MVSLVPLKVLIPLHTSVDTMDFVGPLEFLNSATHTLPNASLDPESTASHKVFSATITASQPVVTSSQGLKVQGHISIREAYSNLADYSVLIIPGGGSPGVLGGQTEPLGLIKAFVSLPKKKDGGVRYILSVCTGSLFLAEAGILAGKSATTHAHYYHRLREVSVPKGKTEVLEERFVVNKLDNEKGLQIITSGGVSCGMDSSLWLIGHIAGEESKERVADLIQYQYRHGVVL